MSECVPHARARMLTSRLHPHVPPAQISPHMNVLRLDMCLPRFQHGSEGGSAAGALGMGASARGRSLMDRRPYAISHTSQGDRPSQLWSPPRAHVRVKARNKSARCLSLLIHSHGHPRLTNPFCPFRTNHYANLHGFCHCSYIPMARPRAPTTDRTNPSCPFRLCPFHGTTLSLNTYALPTLFARGTS